MSPTPWPQLLLERTASNPRLRAHTEAQRHLARLREDQDDFALSLQWLEQAVAGIEPSPSTAAAASTLRGYLRDVGDLRDAAQRVLDEAAAPEVAPLLAGDTPLFRYLSSLYESCEKLLATFEDLARGLRRNEPIWPVFQYRAINKSFSAFDRLTTEIHDEVRALEARRDEGALRALDHRLEELFWAASWLHLSLTKRFGE